MDAAHVRTLLEMVHLPLLEVRVKPEPTITISRGNSGKFFFSLFRFFDVPDAVAVNVAHVPVVYQVPPLIIQPFTLPPLVTGSVPLPEKGVPGVVVVVGVGGAVVAVDMVVDGGGDEPFGRYLIPVAGQSDFEPSGQCKLWCSGQQLECLYLGWLARRYQSAHYPGRRRNTKSRLEPSYCTESQPGRLLVWPEPPISRLMYTSSWLTEESPQLTGRHKNPAS